MTRGARLAVPQAKAVILQRIADGDYLGDIARTYGMPSVAVIAEWRRTDPDFDRDFATAMEGRALRVVDEILDIAEDAGWVETPLLDADGEPTGRVRRTLDSTKLGQDKLRIDTRKWLASVWHARAFGARSTTELTGEGGGAVRLLIGPTADAYVAEQAKQARLTKDTKS